MISDGLGAVNDELQVGGFLNDFLLAGGGEGELDWIFFLFQILTLAAIVKNLLLLQGYRGVTLADYMVYQIRECNCLFGIKSLILMVLYNMRWSLLRESSYKVFVYSLDSIPF